MGSQTKIYIRPIQHNLDTSDETPEEHQKDVLKERCVKCSNEFNMIELRYHVDSCTYRSLPELHIESDEDLPDPKFNIPDRAVSIPWIPEPPSWHVSFHDPPSRPSVATHDPPSRPFVAIHDPPYTGWPAVDIHDPPSRPSADVHDPPSASRPSVDIHDPPSRPSADVHDPPSASWPSVDIHDPPSQPSVAIHDPPYTGWPAVDIHNPPSLPSADVHDPPSASQPSVDIHDPPSQPSADVHDPPSASRPSVDIHDPPSRPSAGVHDPPSASRPSADIHDPPSQPSVDVHDPPSASRPSVDVHDQPSQPSVDVHDPPSASRPSVAIHNPPSRPVAFNETEPSSQHSTFDHHAAIHQNLQMSENAKSCIEFCIKNNITEPTEILQYLQNHIIHGRQLDLASDIDFFEHKEGDTTYICIDRTNLLETAFEEISSLSQPDLRRTLEVQFYNEAAVDCGGPRMEFFTLVLQAIKEKYFDTIRPFSSHYIVIGKIMALSLLQNGKLPRLLDHELLEEVFHSTNPRKFVFDIRRGLDALGLFQIVSRLPLLIHFFTAGVSSKLSYKQLVHFFTPELSPEGSNQRMKENQIYRKFLKYLREVSGGRRAADLKGILRFATGSEEEPCLGFRIHPSIKFVESQSFLPTANTCVHSINLTIPSQYTELPDEEFLFNLYDYAFCNQFFGLQ